MKRLLIVCLSLTVCCMGIWGLITARAATQNGAPAYISAPPEHTVYDNALPTDSLPSADNLLPTDSLPPIDNLLPTDSGEAEPSVRAPMLALTFDDGPSEEFTLLLLDGLRERGVHATFFMVGTRVEKFPDIVLRVYEEGHVIGGHSYDHKTKLTKLNSAALEKQVHNTADMIAKITESAPPFLLRPPYGVINEATAAKTGKAIMLWNIDPRDWDVRDAEKVRQHIVKYAVDGGVVILHDIVGSTVEGVLLAIDDLQQEGWVFVTLPQMYQSFDITLEAGGIYRSPEAYIIPQK